MLNGVALGNTYYHATTSISHHHSFIHPLISLSVCINTYWISTNFAKCEYSGKDKSWPYATAFLPFLLLHHYDNPVIWILFLYPLYRWGNWGSRIWHHLPSSWVQEEMKFWVWRFLNSRNKLSVVMILVLDRVLEGERGCTLNRRNGQKFSWGNICKCVSRIKGNLGSDSHLICYLLWDSRS